MVGVVSTIIGKCKRCYTCVRHCPANAIKVENGQAVVIEERCVGCGTCYKVCAQGAKEIANSVEQVRVLLAAGSPVVACLAPSFPAAFFDLRPGQVITAVRRLGFDQVLEVAFGAELLGREYARLAREGREPLIASPCPAVVSYVEKYAPKLIPNLVPLVSPMIALGRVVKQQYLPGARVVFIGPCIAKKAEIEHPAVAGAVDAVLTFEEFRQMLFVEQIDAPLLPETSFDGPQAHLAGIFPVSGGLLRTAALQQDILDNTILVTDGREHTLQIIEGLLDRTMSVRFLDLLFCEGCIDGPVIGDGPDLFGRKEIVANYVRSRVGSRNEAERDRLLEEYAGVDLSRTFRDQSMPLPLPAEQEIRAILRQTNKTRPEDELNCGACGYSTCREKAIAVYQGLAEAQMCLPFLIEQLEENVVKLERFQSELQATQKQLIQSEKLASMGQLAAGVAHEINNPLGTILLYSDIMYKEIPSESQHASDLKRVMDEAARCKRIVSDLLNFARQNRVSVQEIDLNGLVEQLCGELQAQPLFAGVQIVLELAEDLDPIHADAAQLRQAFVNLLDNAADATPEGGRLAVTTRRRDGTHVAVSVQDMGSGIAEEDLNKIFTPFFTTKPIGRGTGLGLSIVYGIVKMHHGQIDVQSEVGVGTTFTVTLPTELEVSEEPLQDARMSPGSATRYQLFS
jgi:two-component system NtrC family sensor kinase